MYTVLSVLYCIYLVYTIYILYSIHYKYTVYSYTGTKEAGERNDYTKSKIKCTFLEVGAVSLCWFPVFLYSTTYST